MMQLKMHHPNLADLASTPPLPEGYCLRPYEEQDMPSLIHTLNVAFPGMNWTEETVRKSLLDDPTVLETYVVVHEDNVVATASSQQIPNPPNMDCYLHWVATDPQHQGKKLGMVVSYGAVEHFKRLGAKEAFLMTDDFRTSAITIYLRMGFRPCLVDETHPQRWEAIFTSSGVVRPD